MQLDDLSTDVLHYLSEFLDSGSLLSLRCINRRFNHFLNDQSRIWWAKKDELCVQAVDDLKKAYLNTVQQVTRLVASKSSQAPEWLLKRRDECNTPVNIRSLTTAIMTDDGRLVREATKNADPSIICALFRFFIQQGKDQCAIALLAIPFIRLNYEHLLFAMSHQRLAVIQYMIDECHLPLYTKSKSALVPVQKSRYNPHYIDVAKCRYFDCGYFEHINKILLVEILCCSNRDIA
ncbi:MAG: hypothetical protein KDH94_05015, partial [Coxiellaceae bacterium]|nr:hypothetical protein [Coxiellaceae bacterium]